jgi:Bacterial cellulose synthase subunit
MMKALLKCSALALLLVSNAAFADETVHWMPWQRELALAGPEAETDFVFEASASAKDPVLHLAWSLSNEIDVARAVLRVRVDGGPARTIRLSDAERRVDSSGATPLYAASIRIGNLRKSGVHHITIASHLFESAADCLRHESENVWLRFDPTSELSWTRAGSASVSPNEWLREAQAAPASERVVLKAPNRTSLLTLAYFDVVRSLERRDIRTTSLPTKDMRSFALELTRERPLPETLCAALTIEGTRATLSAPSEAGLRCGARALRSDLVWAACKKSPCYLPKAWSENSAQSLQQEARSNEVWSLASLVGGKGYSIFGEGTGELAWTWVRPPSFTVQHTPTISFDVRHGPMALIDSLSSLSLTLNEKPLATWVVSGDDGASQTLRANIPREEWAKDAWSFTLRTGLRRPETLRCRGVDARNTWISIDSGNLLVPREERSSAALSSFFRGLSGDAPTLVIAPELTWTEVHAVAALFASSTKRGDYVFSGSCNSPFCVELKRSGSKGAAAPARAVRVGTGDQMIWTHDDGSSALPAIAASETMLARHLEQAGNHVLEIWSPTAQAPERLSSLENVSAQAAIETEGAWLEVVSSKSRTTSSTEVAPPTLKDDADPVTVVPEQKKLLLRIDTVFAPLIALSILLGIFWALRGNRNSAQLKKSEKP